MFPSGTNNAIKVATLGVSQYALGERYAILRALTLIGDSTENLLQNPLENLRFNKCKVDILHGHCPGSHNVKCCPVGQVDKGETAPQPPSAMKNDISPKDPGKLLKKLKKLQDKVRKEKAVGSQMI